MEELSDTGSELGLKMSDTGEDPISVLGFDITSGDLFRVTPSICGAKRSSLICFLSNILDIGVGEGSLLTAVTPPKLKLDVVPPSAPNPAFDK